jgi:hypothetical protein
VLEVAKRESVEPLKVMREVISEVALRPTVGEELKEAFPGVP